MNEINDTTRMFSRTLDEAFPNTVQHNAMLENCIWFEPHQPKEIGYQFWYYVVLSFLAGYFFFKIWG